MAAGTLVSRVTGFLRQLALVSVLGLGVVNDSYTVANTLPNIVYELLLGGVLTSIMVPLLVRAQTDDPDGGEAYTRRLLTVAGAALVLATLVAMATAPLLTRLYLGDGDGPANPDLATAFAWLLLPQIFFYGLGALLGALLNTRGVFGPFAWAPVLNNVVVIAVLAVYAAMPGPLSLDPVRMGEPKLLVLGLGTTLGIAVQALVLIPAVRRAGFRYRPLWGWDRRLGETGGLALWVVAYVLIGQVGYIVTTRVAADAAPGSVAIYANAWLLLQVPYGVLGVSLLTALMPRMSRAAAEGRTTDVVADLALGIRLSAVVLLPVSVLLTLFGTELGVALFSLGAGAADGGSARLGATLAASAFGLLPFAVVMLQLRVFYALTDSRTPTLLQLLIVGVKVPLLLAAPLVLPPTGWCSGSPPRTRPRSSWARWPARSCCTGGWAGSAPGPCCAPCCAWRLPLPSREPSPSVPCSSCDPPSPIWARSHVRGSSWVSRQRSAARRSSGRCWRCASRRSRRSDSGSCRAGSGVPDRRPDTGPEHAARGSIRGTAHRV